jgi:hypothetical protein
VDAAEAADVVVVAHEVVAEEVAVGKRTKSGSQ